MSRTIMRGSTEYLTVSVTADITLDAQPVAFSFDRTIWLPAEWVGTAGTTRSARLLVSDTNLPAPPTTSTAVYVKVTDNPEVPIVQAGGINLV